MSMADRMETLMNAETRRISSRRETPLLMCGEMIRATLEDRKTQTRRVIKPQPEQQRGEDSWLWKGGPALRRASYGADYVHTDLLHVKRAMLKVCPYGGVGDVLWIKETHAPHPEHPRVRCAYQADLKSYGLDNGKAYPSLDSVGAVLGAPVSNPKKPWGGKWKPSIFMRREYSRITLEITDVRVERVREISDSDAIAEGIKSLGTGLWRSYDHPTGYTASPITSYETLWESINGKGSWALNPFVFVIEFRRIKP